MKKVPGRKKWQELELLDVVKAGDSWTFSEGRTIRESPRKYNKFKEEERGVGMTMLQLNEAYPGMLAYRKKVK